MKTTPKPTIPKHARAWAAVAALVALSGTAQAAPVFQGRLADNTASATCTPSGTGGTTQCTSFHLSDPDNSSFQGFTILNNWSIGRGSWSGTTPPAPGSAHRPSRQVPAWQRPGRTGGSCPPATANRLPAR